MLEVFADLTQGTEDWLALRAAIPTASNFATVMASGRNGEESKTRRQYMLRLIAQKMTGDVEEGFSSIHTERGHKQEADIRDAYSFIRDAEVQQVGFLRNTTPNGHPVGCSPDGLIGTNGMFEAKSKLGSIQLEILLKQQTPPEYIAQLQGGLWVAEREYIDFMSHTPRIPPFIQRHYRDEAYIKRLASEVDRFWEDMLRIEALVLSGNITGPVSTSRPIHNPLKTEF